MIHVMAFTHEIIDGDKAHIKVLIDGDKEGERTAEIVALLRALRDKFPEEFFEAHAAFVEEILESHYNE